MLYTRSEVRCRGKSVTTTKLSDAHGAQGQAPKKIQETDAIFANIRDIVGGRSGEYERVLREAKDHALREMEEQARMLGADAILGVDLDYETIGNNGSMLMVTSSGTAVKLA